MFFLKLLAHTCDRLRQQEEMDATISHLELCTHFFLICTGLRVWVLSFICTDTSAGQKNMFFQSEIKYCVYNLLKNRSIVHRFIYKISTEINAFEIRRWLFFFAYRINTLLFYSWKLHDLLALVPKLRRSFSNTVVTVNKNKVAEKQSTKGHC